VSEAHLWITAGALYRQTQPSNNATPPVSTFIHTSLCSTRHSVAQRTPVGCDRSSCLGDSGGPGATPGLCPIPEELNSHDFPVVPWIYSYCGDRLAWVTLNSPEPLRHKVDQHQEKCLQSGQLEWEWNIFPDYDYPDQPWRSYILSEITGSGRYTRLGLPQT